MATVNLGRVGLVLKGEYDASTKYEKLDVVTYQGSSYIAKQTTTGNAPTNESFWQLQSEKGEKGDKGDAGGGLTRLDDQTPVTVDGILAGKNGKLAPADFVPAEILPTNTVAQAGIVAAPTANNANSLWSTDGSGNPAWRYYDYQTKAQIQQLIAEAISESGHASFEKVDEVPTPQQAQDNILYLVYNEGSEHYDIYAKVGNEVLLIDDTTVDLTNYATLQDLAKKVDVVPGKQLSTNDYTTAEKDKLAKIEDDAEANTIETVKVNGTPLVPDAEKAVDVKCLELIEMGQLSVAAGYSEIAILKSPKEVGSNKCNISLIISGGEDFGRNYQPTFILNAGTRNAFNANVIQLNNLEKTFQLEFGYWISEDGRYHIGIKRPTYSNTIFLYPIEVSPTAEISNITIAGALPENWINIKIDKLYSEDNKPEIGGTNLLSKKLTTSGGIVTYDNDINGIIITDFDRSNKPDKDFVRIVKVGTDKFGYYSVSGEAYASANVELDIDLSGSSHRHTFQLTKSPQKIVGVYNITSFSSDYWTEVGGAIDFSVPKEWKGTIYVKNLKLERGEIATDWTPAPEDLEAEIPTKTSELTNDSGFITSNDIPEGASASNTVPKAPAATGSVGNELAFARGDHVHPMQPGIGNPIEIPANSNLNDYIWPGSYYCHTVDRATTISNAPEATAFSLIVIKNYANSIGTHQLFIPYFNNYLFIRALYDEDISWKPWTRVASTTDITASNFSGILPIEKGGTGSSDGSIKYTFTPTESTYAHAQIFYQNCENMVSSVGNYVSSKDNVVASFLGVGDQSWLTVNSIQMRQTGDTIIGLYKGREIATLSDYATASKPGLIKPGTGCEVTSDGTLNIDIPEITPENFAGILPISKGGTGNESGLATGIKTQELADKTNANSYTAPGSYICRSRQISNYPYDFGWLIVYNGAGTRSEGNTLQIAANYYSPYDVSTRIQVGTGMWSNWKTLGESTSEIPVASATTLGGVKVGDNMKVTEDGTLTANLDGYWSNASTLYRLASINLPNIAFMAYNYASGSPGYVLPTSLIASKSNLGLIKTGTGLTIDTNGVVSVDSSNLITSSGGTLNDKAEIALGDQATLKVNDYNGEHRLWLQITPTESNLNDIEFCLGRYIDFRVDNMGTLVIETTAPSDGFERELHLTGFEDILLNGTPNHRVISSWDYATTSNAGIVKVGSGLSVDSEGTLSVDSQSTTNNFINLKALYVHEAAAPSIDPKVDGFTIYATGIYPSRTSEEADVSANCMINIDSADVSNVNCYFNATPINTAGTLASEDDARSFLSGSMEFQFNQSRATFGNYGSAKIFINTVLKSSVAETIVELPSYTSTGTTYAALAEILRSAGITRLQCNGLSKQKLDLYG